MSQTKHSVIPHFKKTSFPRILHNDKGFLNRVQSSFAKTSSQQRIASYPNEPTEEPIDYAPDPSQHFTNVVVVHPGSRSLKIGLASDAFPKEIPHVVARKLKLNVEDRVLGAEIPLLKGSEQISLIDKELKQRIRQQKIRILPTTYQQAVTFNQQVQPDIIPDHNDYNKIENTEVKESNTYFIGKDAIRLAELSKDKTNWKLYYPFKYGILNVEDYESSEHCMSDIDLIWSYALENVLNIPKEKWNDYHFVLIIPDSFNRKQAKLLMKMILIDMKFKACLLVQEGVGGAFGAGIPTACIVDIGAKYTSVSCIEDGFLNIASRRSLKYGGDDVSVFLMHLLKERGFPYKECDLAKHMYDWIMIEDLKNRMLTLAESDLAMHMYDFFVRIPDKLTKQYKLKVFDAALKAAWILFYPEIIDFPRKLENFLLKDTFLDYGGVNFSDTNVFTKEERKRGLEEFYNYIHPKSKKLNTEDDEYAKTEDNIAAHDVDEEDDDMVPNDLENDIDFKSDVSNSLKRSISETGNSDESDISSIADFDLSNDESDTSIIPPKEEEYINDISDPEDAVTKAINKDDEDVPRTNTDNSSDIEVKSVGYSSDTTKDELDETKKLLLDSDSKETKTIPTNSFLNRRRGFGTIAESSIPLHEAIAQSISNCIVKPSENSTKILEQRIRKLCSSIIVVGGASRIRGLGRVIEDKVYSAILQTEMMGLLASKNVAQPHNFVHTKVLPAPRGIDPRYLVWKGASIISKIESSAEFWILENDILWNSPSKLSNKMMFSDL